MSEMSPAAETDAELVTLAGERRALEAAVALLAELDVPGVALEPEEDDWS